MRKYLFIFFAVVASFKISAQNVTKTPLIIKLVCAKSDNSINISELKNCKTLILLGDESDTYRIQGGLVLYHKDGRLTENPFSGQNLSEITIANLDKLKSGDKVFIENITIVNFKNKETKKMPSLKFVVK